MYRCGAWPLPSRRSCGPRNCLTNSGNNADNGIWDNDYDYGIMIIIMGYRFFDYGIPYVHAMGYDHNGI